MSVQYQITQHQVNKTDTELLRDRWSNSSYPMNQVILFGVKAFRLLESNDSVEATFIERFDAFLNELTTQEFLERINLTLEHINEETRVNYEVQVSQPRKGFIFTTRRWFKETLPELDDATIRPLIDLIIETFQNRPVIQSPYNTNEWYQGSTFTISEHRPVRKDRVIEDLTDLIDEGGMVSLRRFGMVLSTTAREGAFFKRYPKGQCYSIQ